MNLLSFETDVTQNMLQTNSKLETSTLSIARVITPKGIRKGRMSIYGTQIFFGV